MIIHRPLSPRALELHAQQFRERYAPGVQGHVDVENVVEIKRRLPIDPRPNLMARSGMYGFLAMDGQTIKVDVETQLSWPQAEYFKLLAHELAHAELHRTLLVSDFDGSEAAFVKFHEGLPQALRFQLEAEARYWGRALRMPAEELSKVFGEAIELARDAFESVTQSAARLFVEFMIAEHFGVPEQHVEMRMKDLKIWGPMRREERQAAALQAKVALSRL